MTSLPPPWLLALDPLLSPDSIRDRLQVGLLQDHEVREVTTLAVDLDPARRWIVLYRVGTKVSGGEQRTLLVHVVRGGGRQVAREARAWMARNHELGDPRRFLDVDRSRDRTLARFPCDFALRHLGEFASSRHVHRLLQESRPGPGPAVPGADVQVLSYWPRRRCTVRWQVPGGDRTIVRLRSRRPALDPAWRRVVETPSFAPRLLGTSRRALSILEEWRPGVPLTRVRPQPTWHALGALVARFHEWTRAALSATPPPSDTPPGTSLHHRALIALETLAQLAPETTAGAHDLLLTLAARGPVRSSEPPVGVHGSLRPSRILSHPSGLVLAGLGGVRHGPAALDLAILAAQLMTPARADQDVLAALVEGYAEVRRPPTWSELHHHLGPALAVAAVEPFCRVEPHAPALARHRLAIARSLTPRPWRPRWRLGPSALPLAWSLR